MTGQYSGIEICKIGIEVEKNGYQFYTKAAEMVDDFDLQQLFKQLANDEKDHETVYRRILELLESTKPDEKDSNLGEEYGLYIQALADSRVFSGKKTVEKVLAKIEDPMDLFDIAMGFEKDAILYFMETKNFVGEEDQAILDQFIDYEKNHLKILNERKQIYLANKN